jgi:ubiquinone/menaquinone biosynthesis C-methylase UbiE
MSEDESEWENRYQGAKPEDLPWNAGHADQDLVTRVTQGTIPRGGEALDAGTGVGHDAVFLLEQGFNVIGVDISPSAIRMARENASHHGLFGYFQTGDIRRLPIEDVYVNLVTDCGCLHVLSEADQTLALKEYHRVLMPRGLVFLKTHSDQGKGPHAMSKSALQALVSPLFDTLEMWEGIFEGSSHYPFYGLLLKKKR